MNAENKKILDRISDIVSSGNLASKVSDEIVPKTILAYLGEKPGARIYLFGPCTPEPKNVSRRNPRLYNEFLSLIQKLGLAYEIDTIVYPGKLSIVIAKDQNWLAKDRETDREQGEFYGYPPEEIKCYLNQASGNEKRMYKFVEEKTNFDYNELSRARRFTCFVPCQNRDSILRTAEISTKRANILENIDASDNPNLYAEIARQLDNHMTKHQLVERTFQDGSKI